MTTPLSRFLIHRLRPFVMRFSQRMRRLPASSWNLREVQQSAYKTIASALVVNIEM